MMKKVILTIAPHAFSFTEKYNFFPRSTKIIFLQGGFVILDIVFGCDDPTYYPSPVRELSLLTQFSGIATLQSLVSEKQCKGAGPITVLSMRIDATSHITPVHLSINCKAEC